MGHLLATILIIGMSVSVFHPQLSAKSLDYKSLPVDLNPTQIEALTKTGEIGDLLIEDHNLWILTARSLFYWNLQNLRLREIKWPSTSTKGDASAQLQIIRLDEKRLMVRRGARFHLIEKAGVQSKTLLPGKRSISLAHRNLDDSISLIDLSYIHRVSHKDFSYLGYVKLPKNLQKPSYYQFLHGQHYLAGKQVVLQYMPKNKMWKEIFRPLGSIKGLHLVGGQLAVATSIGLSVFDEQGMIAQSIPVRGKAKLIRAKMSASFHDYLLSNKYVLRYSTAKKKRFDIELHLGRVAKVSAFTTNTSYAAGVFDSKLRVFKFPEPVIK